MASQNFNTIMLHIFEVEGGYVDHPRDPGGATNMGITLGTLSRWRGRRVSKEEVKNLTKMEAKNIYFNYYWEEVDCDEWPSGLDLLMMDACVNSGPSGAVKWLQRAVGVDDDGRLGPITKGSVRASQSLLDLIRSCMEERRKSVRTFRNYDVFGRGWENRLNSVEHRALELAKNG